MTEALRNALVLSQAIGHIAAEALSWLLASITAVHAPDADQIRRRIADRVLRLSPPEQMQAQFAMFASQMAPLEMLEVRADGDRQLVAVVRSAPTDTIVEIRCVVDDGGLISDLGITKRPDVDGMHFETVDAYEITSVDQVRIHQLFAESYADANQGYLDESLERLGAIALARVAGDLVGFAIGRTRVLDLPDLPEQTVCLAGLCCVATRLRRRGLMVWLEQLVMRHDADVASAPRLLMAGRMAHPASLRAWRANPTLIPSPRVAPSAWHQEIGRRISAEYGITGFDPATFVCIGTGEAVGVPKLDLDVTDEEWEVFGPVQRDRGDSLLALAWTPNCPDGWLG